MDIQNCFYTGKILKPHGIHGALVIKIEVDYFDTILNEIDYFFFEIDGFLVPFCIAELTYINQDTATAIFEEISDETEGKKFINTNLYLPNELIPDNLSEFSRYDHLKGYSITDQKFGYLGLVSDVMHYSMNTVLQIMRNEKEILIPASETIIIEVNEINKEILINAPDGLIEIYL